mmetsp:Transcript_1127/g.1021  ORF Transcript_1127/g.1021 Transcript_1127/m.1021 type:complete len:236 (-) Transcript_1127:2363-3070(-)
MLKVKMMLALQPLPSVAFLEVQEIKIISLLVEEGSLEAGISSLVKILLLLNKSQFLQEDSLEVVVNSQVKVPPLNQNQQAKEGFLEVVARGANLQKNKKKLNKRPLHPLKRMVQIRHLMEISLKKRKKINKSKSHSQKRFLVVAEDCLQIKAKATILKKDSNNPQQHSLTLEEGEDYSKIDQNLIPKRNSHKNSLFLVVVVDCLRTLMNKMPHHLKKVKSQAHLQILRLKLNQLV